MEEVLHANIFFFITGIAVIIFTLFSCVVLFHGVKVLRSLQRILDRVESETAVIAEDMQNVRAYFAQDGLIRRLFTKLMGNPKVREESDEVKKHARKRNELKIKDQG